MKLKAGKIYTFNYHNKNRIGRYIGPRDFIIVNFEWGNRKTGYVYKSFYRREMENVKRVGLLSLILNFFTNHLYRREL